VPPRISGSILTQRPSPVLVLGDPVVQALAGLEIGGEPAANPGRDPPVTQEGTAQQREVAAGANHALPGRPADANRSRVQPQQRAEDPDRRAQVSLTQAGLPQAEITGLVRLDDQQVHGHAHLHRIIPDTLQGFRRESLQPGQRARLGVVDLPLHDATVAGQLIPLPGLSHATLSAK
jgi:hypothetical protein